MIILGIESSCDETAAAVVEDGSKVLSSVISSQIEIHKKFGGVVPEIASRKHCENIYEVVSQALLQANVKLSEIDAIAVTYAPGLIGALLVGVSFAKGLAISNNIPLVPVHHIAGHIAANYVAFKDLQPPYLCLVASGGHSHIVEVLSHTQFKVIGRTRDDAAGECFDKVARILGFPYPGGVHIDKSAKLGDENAYQFPHPKVTGSELDFSFSGLKTAVINLVHNCEQKSIDIDKNSVAASFQKTITDILVEKTIKAANMLNYDKIAVAGGVSANSGLRNKMEIVCSQSNKKLYIPPLSLCGDNAVMIATQGYYDYLDGKTAKSNLNGIATLSLENL